MARRPSTVSWAAEEDEEKGSYQGEIIPADGVNLNRAGLRIESMQTYAIVSSIVTGSSIGLFGVMQMNHGEDEEVTVPTKIVEGVFVFSQALSLISSVYTTFIFTLMALYYSTSLGLGGDECFQAFDDDTKQMRRRAFKSFVTSMVTIMISFLACIFLLIDGIAGLVMTAILSVLIALAFLDFNFVIKSASRHIFNPLLMNPRSKLEKIASKRRLSGGGEDGL